MADLFCSVRNCIRKRTRSLAGELLLLLAASILSGLLFFFLLEICSEAALSRFLLNSSYLKNMEAAAVEQLQELVREEQLTPYDEEALSSWIAEEGLIYLEIYRDHRLLYSPIGLIEDEYGGSMYYGEGNYTIYFADGPADVLIIGMFEYRFYTYTLIAEIFLSFAVFLVIFLWGINRRIRYILQLRTEIGIMEGGCLDHAVEIQGHDELADLADGLEQLRRSFRSNIQAENDLAQANHALITGIAHDLRTPLTALTMYAQILQSDVCTDEEKKQYYLEKIMSKAALMKDLSDRLFECSQISSSSSGESLTERRTIQGAFMDDLSEMAIYLENQNFTVQADLEWRSVLVDVRMDYLSRIMNNISSNLVKYADPDFPVILRIIYEPSMAGMEITNKIMKQKSGVESTKVGMENIRRMMSQMDGSCQVNMDQETYSIRLLFPAI